MCLYFSATIVFLLFTSCSAQGTHVEFEPWGNWSECSTTCSYGIQVKTRICPTNVQCTLDQVGQMIRCKLRECPIDGGWSPWSAWSRCSATCGEDGRQRRARACSNPSPKYGGRFCEGDFIERRPCEGLTPCPVHGGWSEWSSWGQCTAKNCRKAGRQFRTRACDNPTPSQGGQRCLGQQTNTRKCSKPNCNVDGGWSEWSEWSECSVTCGSRGVQRSSRLCDNPVRKRRGRPCSGRTSRERPCPDLELCPGEESASFSEVDPLANSELTTMTTTNQVTSRAAELSATDGLWWSLDSTSNSHVQTEGPINIWDDASSSSASASEDSASFSNIEADNGIGDNQPTTTTTTTTKAMANEGINCDDLGSNPSYSSSLCN